MSKKKIVLLGCGIPLLVSVILVGLIIGWVIHVSQDVKGVSLSIDSPLDIKVGDTFKVTVNVKNEREKKMLMVSDIDISDDYIGGFVLVSTEPSPRSSMHVPFDNSISYTFDTPISAGDTKSYTFVLRAIQPGVFRGDVDVCEGQRFVSTMAQTVVTE